MKLVKINGKWSKCEKAGFDDVVKEAYAADHAVDEYNEIELAIGIQIESEHTDYADVAAKIAMDHLDEDPCYYTKLIQSGLVDESVDMSIGVEELMHKARVTKYIMRIPNPKGKGFIYFYTHKQVAQYKKTGEIPEQKMEGKGLLSGILSFFGLGSKEEAHKKAESIYTEHKAELGGVDLPTFTDYLNEYCQNKDKWDKRFNAQPKEKGEKKEAAEKKEPAEKKVHEEGGKKFNLSVMKKIAGWVGGVKKEGEKSSGLPNHIAEMYHKKATLERTLDALQMQGGSNSKEVDKVRGQVSELYKQIADAEREPEDKKFEYKTNEPEEKITAKDVAKTPTTLDFLIKKIFESGIDDKTTIESLKKEFYTTVKERGNDTRAVGDLITVLHERTKKPSHELMQELNDFRNGKKEEPKVKKPGGSWSEKAAFGDSLKRSHGKDIKEPERDKKIVEYWDSLKVGDEIPNGNPNGLPTIKSISGNKIISNSGVEYTMQELFEVKPGRAKEIREQSKNTPEKSDKKASKTLSMSQLSSIDYAGMQAIKKVVGKEPKSGGEIRENPAMKRAYSEAVMSEIRKKGISILPQELYNELEDNNQHLLNEVLTNHGVFAKKEKAEAESKSKGMSENEVLEKIKNDKNFMKIWAKDFDYAGDIEETFSRVFNKVKNGDGLAASEHRFLGDEIKRVLKESKSADNFETMPEKSNNADASVEDKRKAAENDLEVIKKLIEKKRQEALTFLKKNVNSKLVAAYRDIATGTKHDAKRIYQMYRGSKDGDEEAVARFAEFVAEMKDKRDKLQTKIDLNDFDQKVIPIKDILDSIGKRGQNVITEAVKSNNAIVMSNGIKNAGAWSDGRIMVIDPVVSKDIHDRIKSKYPQREDVSGYDDERARIMVNRVMPSEDDIDTKPAKPVGFKDTDLPVIVFNSSKGRVAINSRYVDFFHKEFGDSITFHSSGEKSPVVVFKDGKKVGVVMPIQMKDEALKNIKDFDTVKKEKIEKEEISNKNRIEKNKKMTAFSQDYGKLDTVDAPLEGMKSVQKFIKDQLEQSQEQVDRARNNGETEENITKYLNGEKKRAVNYIKELKSKIDSKNGKELKDLLHTGNKNSRSFFEDLTGIDLGSTNKSGNDAIDKFVSSGSKELAKAKKAEVGTVRTYKDGQKYRKESEGKWVRVVDKKGEKQEAKPEEKPKKDGEKKKSENTLDDEKRSTIKTALQKVATILADALSAKSVLKPTNEAVKDTGENIEANARKKKVIDQKKKIQQQNQPKEGKK